MATSSCRGIPYSFDHPEHSEVGEERSELPREAKMEGECVDLDWKRRSGRYDGYVDHHRKRTEAIGTALTLLEEEIAAIEKSGRGLKMSFCVKMYSLRCS